MADDTFYIQMTIIVIIGVVAIILVMQGKDTYIALITALLGYLAPSPLPRLMTYFQKE